MKKVLKLCCFTCLIVWIFLLFVANQSMADTYCVSDEADLISALNDAKDNGSDDVIQVQQGTYNGNFVYASMESFGLTVEGGYTAICASRVVDPDNTVLDGEGNGAVLVLSAPDVTADFVVDGLTLQNGNVTNNGGGLFAVTNGTVTLTNNTIINNSAGDSAGGIYLNSSSNTVTLTNNTIINNSAGDYGGGILFITSSSSGSLTLTNNNISNNSAADGYGGGIYFSNSSFTGSITLNNNNISNNSAKLAGGVSLHSRGPLTLTSNSISNNSADGSFGGALLHSRNGPIDLINNTINNNSAGNYSGGFFSETSFGQFTLTNNTINNNSAGDYGGGIVLAPHSSSLTMSNNAINNNSAGDYGGGICFRDTFTGPVILSNNTISSNNSISSGGGIWLNLYLDGAVVDIYNNIIWNNSAGNGGGDLYIENDGNKNYLPSTVNLYNNDFDQSANGTYIQIPFTIDPSNLDNEDPLFVDPDNGDFHLSDDSPCIDKGNSSAPELPLKDKDGKPRIIDGDRDLIAIVDIGAYEYGLPKGDLDGDGDIDGNDLAIFAQIYGTYVE